LACLVERIEPHEALHVERHSRPRRQLPRVIDLRKKLELVEIAIHIVEAGDAVACEVPEAALEHFAVMPALTGSWSGIGFAARRQAKPLAPAAIGQIEHRAEGAAF